MEVKTKCKIGELVTIRGNERVWRVIAIHISSYTSTHQTIVYDLEDKDGCRVIIQEPKIREVVVPVYKGKSEWNE